MPKDTHASFTLKEPSEIQEFGGVAKVLAPVGGGLVELFAARQNGNKVFFRIKCSTQLKKLMNAYCDRQSVDFNLIAFLFDGRMLRGEQTHAWDGDEINAMLHQTGGGIVLN